MAKKAAAKKNPPASYRDEALRVQDKEHFSGKPQKKPGPLKKPVKSKNPIGDFLKGESDKRKLPVVTEQKPKARGNPNRAKTPGVINQGHTPGSASRAVVPYKAPASKVGSVLRGVGTVAKVASGPVGFAVGMVADAKPAGAGSDKPKGPLMQGTRMRTRPERPGSYPAAKAKTPEAPKTRRATTPPHAGLNKAPATTPAAPAKKPVSKAPKPTARPSLNKGSASPPAYTPDNPQKRGNVTSGFSGNWVGAAPTDMQKRGGAKIDRGGGLLGKLRKK